MYHIVWIPRNRYEVLVNGVDEYLKIKMDEIRKSRDRVHRAKYPTRLYSNRGEFSAQVQHCERGATDETEYDERVTREI